MTSLIDWFDSRTGYRHLLREVLLEPVPGGARWRYVWGSTLVFTFAVQVITGLFLWTAYSPSAQTAWESVYFIQDVMSYGWLVRGIHHYSAQAMVVLMALHLIQVIVDGAYRAPREINFWLGLILMQIVFGLALTGYLLPWDQKGYYATQVSTEIMGAAPVVGPLLQQLVQGGAKYGHHTLTRFFAMHAGFLPAALMLFLVLHVYMFRRHGLTVRSPQRRPETTFWPDQVLRDAVACLGVLAVVLLCVIFKGADLSAPADPSEPYSAARPEWYFLFLFRFLKFQQVEHYGLAFGAIYVPTAILVVFVLMPLVGRWKAGHAFNVFFVFVLMAGIAGLTGLAIYEDRRNADFQLAVNEADRSGERAVQLARRPEMIPVAGAVTLLRDDPLSQGPKIFAANCSSCHRYNETDGTGRKVTVAAKESASQGSSVESRVEAPATAADLGNLGSREWIRSVLVDFKNHFAPLRNAVDKKVPEDLLDNGEMADWSETNKGMLTDPANKESLDALVELLASQSGRFAQTPEQKALVEQGRKIFETGTLAKGKLSANCVDCHSIAPAAAKKGGVKESSAPALAGYGSVDWLTRFIADPGRPENYGEHNHMPAFKNQLSARESDLLARWLAGDYYRSSAPITAAAH
ncbi:MAG TPA: cytochrome b N-terminal domain-containing protein [Planctomycetaceae bacterium]|jgi:ubiquinol-cytochrome c reductase cytochrome b subunit|nr:cytochrome b N-terminal domain-containing protein [Planctomycetaceae bacterium]